MNPFIAKLALQGVDQDQSSSQGVSKSIKKQTKGKSIVDLIGGVGSFASILGKKGTFLSTDKNGDGKKVSVNNKGELAGGMFKKGERLVDNESVTLERMMSLDKSMKQSSEVTSSKLVLDAKPGRKIFPGKLDKSPFSESEGSIDTATALDLTKVSHGQHHNSANNESISELDTTLSLKKNVRGPAGGAMPIMSETNPDLGPTAAAGTKENNPVKKPIMEKTSVSRVGDGTDVHKSDGDLDLSKGFEIKGVIVNKDSSDTKEHGILSKSDSLKPGGAQETTISNKANPVNEEAQEYKNLFPDGRPSEKSIERGLNDTLVTKTDTSLWTAQADFSGVQGIKDGSVVNMNGDIVTPLQFQDIMDQIEDSAAQMLKKGPDRIVITLEPPNLGTLNMDVRVHNDMVRLILIADNHEVKQVLHSNLDQLKTALQDQGLNMDHFDVLVQQRSSENPGFHQWGGALFEEGRGRRENTKEDSAPPQVLPAGGDELNEPHLGSISLFA